MDTTEKVPSTRERQAQQRREKIIQASMQLFWEKCVEDTSMEEVAKCSGVGVATVYRYFSTKIELVIETAEFYWQKVADRRRIRRYWSAVIIARRNIFWMREWIFLHSGSLEYLPKREK